MNKDALAARLMAAFLADLDEQLGTLSAELLVLESNPTDPERLNRIFRAAHTLKGAARATGVPYVEPACHALEDLLAEAKEGRRTLDAGAFATLFFATDALTDVAARLKHGQSLDDTAITQIEARVRDTIARPDVSPGVTSATSTALPPSPWAPSASLNEPTLDAGIRVQSDKIDTVMTASSQLVTSRSRLHSRSHQTDELRDFVVRWASDWRQVGPAVRQSLHRQEQGKDLLPMLDAFETNLRRLVHRVDIVANGVASDAQLFGDMIGRLFDRVQEVRLRPFGDVCTQLTRVVRDVSASSGKEASVVVVGGDVEADRAVLDVLREALLHLVRNAVDHGLEPPAERARLGKPAAGTVTVSAALRGDRLIVTVADDGAGIDLAAVRATLAKRGLPVPTDDADILRSLFVSGLSTRSGITAISGRGVGLDAVEAAVHRVGGAVHVTSDRGRGTTFTLECPLTLATIRALLTSVGGQIFAIPTSYVVQLRRARGDDIKRAEGRDVLLTDEAPLPIVPLTRLLGAPFTEQPATGAVSLVVLRANEGTLALAVDQLLNEDEIAVHPIERVDDAIPLLGGAAVLGTGEVAFVLNVAEALPMALGMTGGQRLTADAATTDGRKRILVVDDSITTRTLEQSTVEAAGYEVFTAVDGADAWRLVQERHIDLIVSDVEMPRMDGVTLCETVRASKKYQQIPVILVTALENPAQRMRGLEAGANAYIGKSSFDQVTLVDTIRQLIG